MMAGLPAAIRKRVIDNVAPHNYWMDSGYQEAYNFAIEINPQDDNRSYGEVLSQFCLSDMIIIIDELIQERQDG